MKGYSKPIKVNYKGFENYNWLVRYTDSRGKRRRKFFEKEKEAQLFYERGNIQTANAGIAVAGLPEEDKRAYIDAQKLLEPFGISVLDAIREYVEARERLTPYQKKILDSVKLTEKYCEAVQDSKKCFDAYGEYLDSLRAQNLSPRHINSQESRLSRFMRFFGESTPVMLADAKKIEKWILGLNTYAYKEDKRAGTRRNGEFKKARQETKALTSVKTRNNYRTALLAFFSFCKRKGYVKENPIERVQAIKETPKEPEIFTVSELRNILNYTEAGSDIRAYIAIAAFAGLRLSEAMRLTWNKIDFEDKTIKLDGAITKTSRRRIVKMTDNLTQWLLPYSLKTSTKENVLSSNFEERFKHFKKNNGIIWKHNALRHSSASYYLALIGDEYKTAEQMGHSVQVLKTNYKGLVKEKDAREYFNILPDNMKITPFSEILKARIA